MKGVLAAVTVAVDVTRHDQCHTEYQDCIRLIPWIHSSACPEFFHPDHVKRELWIFRTSWQCDYATNNKLKW